MPLNNTNFGKRALFCQILQRAVPDYWTLSFSGLFPGGSKVDSAFYPAKVDRMSTRNFWELSGQK